MTPKDNNNALHLQAVSVGALGKEVWNNPWNAFLFFTIDRCFKHFNFFPSFFPSAPIALCNFTDDFDDVDYVDEEEEISFVDDG